jgi:hypothetical protein
VGGALRAENIQGTYFTCMHVSCLRPIVYLAKTIFDFVAETGDKKKSIAYDCSFFFGSMLASITSSYILCTVHQQIHRLVSVVQLQPCERR